MGALKERCAFAGCALGATSHLGDQALCSQHFLELWKAMAEAGIDAADERLDAPRWGGLLGPGPRAAGSQQPGG